MPFLFHDLVLSFQIKTSHSIWTSFREPDHGDAGAVHAAMCNKTYLDATGLPTGYDANVNYWNQILVSGAYADPSMRDVPPNGIFLDHPHSCENQNFSNIEVSWTQGSLFRTNVNPYQVTTNVSWTGTFDPTLMDYAHIGVGGDFPFIAQSGDPDNLPTSATTVISDDHTGDYHEYGSSWADSTIPGLLGADGRFNNKSTMMNYAKWSPRLPFTGTYQVYAWQMDPDANASAQAPFTIFHNEGTTTKGVNQQTGITQTWVPLGSYRFSAGCAPQSGYVQLGSNTADGKAIRADAIKFVLQGNPLTTIGDEQAWWTMDNTLCDDSGHGLSATAMPTGAGPSFLSGGGPNGTISCMTFDGVDDYLNVSDATGLNIATGDFSISVWFYRTTNVAGNLRILSKGAGTDTQKGYAIYAGNTSLTVALSNGITRKYSSCTHTALNNWNHLVVTIARNGNLSLYLNGVLQTGATNIADWNGLNLNANPALPLNIGRNANAGQYWPGKICDVRIYQRILSQTEISKLAGQ